MTAGLLVKEVWIGSAGDRSGLRPGDILIAMGGFPITSADDIAMLGSPAESPLTLTVRRAGRLVKIPAAVTTGNMSSEVAVAPAAAGYAVEALALESRAARAGLQIGDRVVAVNGIPPRSAVRITDILTSPSAAPAWIEIIRSDCRIGLLVQ